LQEADALALQPLTWLYYLLAQPCLICYGCAELAARLGTHHPPIVLDVRTRSQYERDEAQIPGSLRVAPDQVEEWAAHELRERSVVAYCT
jgi:hypothetical protein